MRDRALPLLDGLLVVALEQAVSAPFASAKLAAAGARVIKIERPEGDFARSYDSVVHGESAYFIWMNQDKESLVLNVKDPTDRFLLARILGKADVFLQNLAPGAASRLGLDPEELRTRNPRLITCSISGYGETGPYASMKAYDNLVQAETGVLSVTGTEDAPAKVGFSVADISTGMHAYGAILEALLHRERTGEGTDIRLSMFDCLADWMTVPYLHERWTGQAPPRSGLHHALIAPYGPFRAGDGGTLLIAIQNEREWARFCEEVLGDPALQEDPDFASNPLRVEHRDRLNAKIEETFSRWTAEDVAERLKAAGIAFGRLRSVGEMAAHPQLRTHVIGTPSGEAELPLPSLPVRRRPGPPQVPALGAHSEAIRREFA